MPGASAGNDRLIIAMSELDADSVLEAALLCQPRPLSVQMIQTLFGGELTEHDVQQMLLRLQQQYTDRGLELRMVAGGWRFQSRPAMRSYLDRLAEEKPQKYSRAFLETLAVIAYRQPCTRGDIEEVRGVGINSQIVRQLEERGWIEEIGYRDTVGRPALLATTQRFLEDLGLRSLEELPLLQDLQLDGLDAKQLEQLQQRLPQGSEPLFPNDGAQAQERHSELQAVSGADGSV